MLLYLIILLEFKLSILAVEQEHSVCNVRICKCDKLTGLQNYEFRNWTLELKEHESVQELWNIECRCTRRTKVLSFGRSYGRTVIPKAVNHFSISSCLYVTLSAGSFGSQAGQEIHLKDITSLNVEKWAFRRDSISMRLIKLENIGNLVVHSEAFTGIHDENHIYFHNVTWNYVRTRTFSNISLIKRMELKSVKVNEFGSHSFWKVDNIEEFHIFGGDEGKTNCNIDKVNSDALSFMSFNFSIFQCKIRLLRSDAIHISANFAYIVENKIGKLESNSLGSTFNELQFSRNEVDKFDSGSFSRLYGNRSENSSVNFFLQGNTFHKVGINAMDLGDENSVQYFHVLDNAFDCECTNLSWFAAIYRQISLGHASVYFELLLDESICSEHHDLLVASQHNVNKCDPGNKNKTRNPFTKLEPLFVIPVSIAAFLLLVCIFCRFCLKFKCRRQGGDFV